MNVGDKVRCEDAEDAGGLEKGEVYTIEKIVREPYEPTWLYLDKGAGGGWDARRFKVVR